MSKYFFRFDVIGCLLCIVVFLFFPDLDLLVTNFFYTEEKGFTFNNNLFVKFIYAVFAKIHFLYLLIFIGGIIYCTKKNYIELIKYLYFLTVCLLLGPGLIVNIILKDNSLGRPRPQNITHFSGELSYVPAFHYSGECRKNCSFVSGHASIGFYLMALAWIRKSKKWLVYGTLLGLAVGFVRMIQGGHFLSDVIFAGWITYGIFLVSATFMKIGIHTGPNKTE